MHQEIVTALCLYGLLIPLRCLINIILVVMFSTTGSFQHIACPGGPECGLLNCIFSHRVEEVINAGQAPEVLQTAFREPNGQADHDNADGPRKRRRVDAGQAESKSVESPKQRPAIQATSTSVATIAAPVSREFQPALLKTSIRTVSPPPRRRRTATSTVPETSEQLGLKKSKISTQALSPPAKEVVQEKLNPRMLPQPPASHTIRLAIVTKLHEQIVRLNEEVDKSKDPSKRALVLSKQEMISMALDEEEKTARESPSVYSNLIKLRIVALKKMKLEGWKQERLKRIAKDFPETDPQTPGPRASIATGLTMQEELSLLPKLYLNQEALQKFGYVSTPPSKAEIAQAKKGIEAAQGWEQCDRCKTRFQVFPGRRAEDGLLTSGGNCTYHHGKVIRPSKERTDAIKGHKEATYACCNEAVGASVGCTKADTHVFKVSEVKRLAATLPFERTPDNPNKKPAKAVCFDCEMGYTVHGMELIRLTATAWPGGEDLLDVLVRPMGEILDLNSRFSGVWPHHFNDAVPYESSVGLHEAHSEADIDSKPPLKLVDSPAAARSLLFSFLTPETPLIGHAIENDLNVTRIIHPSVIDTVLLYPHPRGLPLRYGLRMLVSKHLDRNIQMGGEQGHDSREDARAAGDLVRLKVGQMWKVMLREGWSMRNGSLVAPPPVSAGTLK